MDYILTGVRLNRNDLQNLKIADCPKCKHPTLQAKINPNYRWHTCLACGSLLRLEYVAK